jgi:hypothetical protein
MLSGVARAAGKAYGDARPSVERATPAAVEDPVGGRAEIAIAKRLIEKIIETWNRRTTKATECKT